MVSIPLSFRDDALCSFNEAAKIVGLPNFAEPKLSLADGRGVSSLLIRPWVLVICAQWQLRSGV